jgi:hypothetical protein
LRDVSTGEKTAIPVETELEIDYMPVIITWNDEELYGVPQILYTK